MKNVYELIQYHGPNYKFSVGWGYYVTSHIHREIEFGIVLEGCIRIHSSGRQWDIAPGEFWFTNPCQCHEFTVTRPDVPYAFLEVQIPTSFFREYFPRADRLRMQDVRLNRETLGQEGYDRLAWLLFAAAKDYFTAGEYYELTCTARINQLLATLLKCAPHRMLTEEELRISNLHMPRIQRITDYIEEHCGEKLLLGDIARREGLSLSYLSHFFADHFGMPFQTYLQHIRCQKAGVMLVETDMTPSDISLACGFSALKYMNRGFAQLFGCSPAQYRQLVRRKSGQPEGRRAAARIADLTCEPGQFEILFHPEDSMAYLQASRFFPPQLRGDA